MTTPQLGDSRLLKLATILREKGDPKTFNMKRVSNGAGTPCCALGYYVKYSRARHGWKLIEGEPMGIMSKTGGMISYLSIEVDQHFALTPRDGRDLFCATGCDDARTPISAARYIERFVKARKKERARQAQKIYSAIFGDKYYRKSHTNL